MIYYFSAAKIRYIFEIIDNFTGAVVKLSDIFTGVVVKLSDNFTEYAI